MAEQGTGNAVGQDTNVQGGAVQSGNTLASRSCGDIGDCCKSFKKEMDETYLKIIVYTIVFVVLAAFVATYDNKDYMDVHNIVDNSWDASNNATYINHHTSNLLTGGMSNTIVSLFGAVVPLMILTRTSLVQNPANNGGNRMITCSPSQDTAHEAYVQYVFLPILVYSFYYLMGIRDSNILIFNSLFIGATFPLRSDNTPNDRTLEILDRLFRLTVLITISIVTFVEMPSFIKPKAFLCALFLCTTAASLFSPIVDSQKYPLVKKIVNLVIVISVSVTAIIILYEPHGLIHRHISTSLEILNNTAKQ
jgi:hypothetical protein